MLYFTTNRQDILTSSIELAQVKRLRIFDRLNQPAKIVELAYNLAHVEAEKKLGTVGRVINLFQYFQQLPYQVEGDDQAIIDRILHRSGFEIRDNVAYQNGKARIKVNKNQQGRLYYVDYLDRFGFTDRRDFYDHGCRSYSEFFEDRARVVTRQYYDSQGRVRITYHYRGSKTNAAILTLIQLWDAGNEYQFNNEMELRAYFLDKLAEADPHAAIISDRSDIDLTALQLMKHRIPCYQVFHYTFTLDGQPDTKLFPVYEPLEKMLHNGQLTGLISSTNREAEDAAHRFKITSSYGIPVTYLNDEGLNKVIPFDRRKPGQLIAVARLAKQKRLDQLINTVVRLHDKHPEVDLKIYGFVDKRSKAVAESLRKLVKDRNASDYVHFCGFLSDLTDVYETAQMEVLTSSHEGFAMTVLEAQGHACPVISYDVSYGPSDIIDDKVSGCLLPSGDTEALYATLDDLLSNPAKLKSYSDHAQAAAAKFSIDNVAKKWADFLTRENLMV